MGYNVQILRSNMTLPAANQAEALRIWKDLNKPENNHLKRRGGRSGGSGKTAHWFSWMDEDYDQTVTSADEVLEMLGFEIEILGNGDILLAGYDSKTGQEDLFIERAAHLMIGRIDWEGEDGEAWAWECHGGDTFGLLAHGADLVRISM